MKKIIILISIIIIVSISILMINLPDKNKNEVKKDIEKNIEIVNENIKIIDEEVFIEMNLKNVSKENIKLDDIDIVVKDSNKEILRIKNEVDKTLKPNESIIVSTQTKANLSKDIHYYLNIEY